MKSTWLEMSDELNKQKKLTDKLIMEMTQKKYRSKLRNVFIPEAIGTVICLIALALIIFNFAMLDTWYLILAGIISVTLLVILPFMSLSALMKMNSIAILENNYKQTLIDYTKAKRLFMRVQKQGLYLGFIFMLMFLPVVSKISNNKDIFLQTEIWKWYIPLGGLFLYFFSRWVYGHYKKSVTAAGDLLADLEE